MVLYHTAITLCAFDADDLRRTPHGKHRACVTLLLRYYIYCLIEGEVEDLQHDPVRNLSAIRDMLAESGLPEAVKEQSIQVFTALGEAEAKTHGSTLDQVRRRSVRGLDRSRSETCLVLMYQLLSTGGRRCRGIRSWSCLCVAAPGVVYSM